MSKLSPAPATRRQVEDLLENTGPAAALAELTKVQRNLCGEDLYFGAQLALLAGDPHQALDWLDRARDKLIAEGSNLVALRTDLGRVNVLADLSQLNDGIAVACRLRSDLAAIDEGSLRYDDVEMHQWLKAAAAENLGATYGLVGHHGDAVQALEEARSLYQAVGSPTDLARTRGNLGIELLETGSPETALGELQWARAQFTHDADEWLVHRCIVAESRSFVLMGDYGEALNRLAESDRFIDDSRWSESPDALRAQLARSDVEVVLNLFPEVLATGKRLQPLLSDRAMKRELAESLVQSAKALVGMQQLEQAEPVARDAVDLFEKAGLRIKAAAARVTLARCLGEHGGQAVVDEALGVLTTTGEHHEIATAALCGADLTTADEDRHRYLETADTACALAAPETAWKSLWHRSALAASQFEADALLDQSLDAIWSLRSGLDTDHLRAPFLVDRRDPLESRLHSHLCAGQVVEAFGLSAKYRAAALRPTPSLREIRGEAPSPAETTLLYQSIGDKLVCFVTTPSTNGATKADIQLADLGPVLGELDDLMVDLEAQWCHLADPRLRVHMDRFRSVADKILQRLHLAVFANVESLLPDGPVTIVPTGRLAAVPFAALHDGTSYLIDRRLLSIAPGVPRQTNPPSAGTTLIVGVPDQRAPNIQSEVERIALVSGGHILVGSDATVEATHSALAHASIIHLAGHSHFRPENPSLSAFTFADRSVTAAELSTWDLTGKTMVLASCSSGRQSNLGEDELQGLPRALLLAGAREVIMNYWDVDDASTASLMSQFHLNTSTQSVAEALRSAQLATRVLYDHPFFWAASAHYRNPTQHRNDPIEQDVS